MTKIRKIGPVPEAFYWLAIMASSVTSSPIKDPVGDSVNSFLPSDFCGLPNNLGGSGSVKFIEDCDSLDRFPGLPVPPETYALQAIHSKVCCPKKWIQEHSICFSTDPWCPTYQPVDLGGSFGGGDSGIAELTMATRLCGSYIDENNEVINSTCTPLSTCSDNLDLPAGPALASICGFDEELNEMMLCCSDHLIHESKPQIQEPRYPDKKTNKARECDDKTDHCSRWKTEGCLLDRSFTLAEDFGPVSSFNMFLFMMFTCTSSCGWCGNKGCVDEMARCKEWAAAGFCLNSQYTTFMGHVCRESCGTCGFLSIFNEETQELNGGTFSDPDDPNFFCGKNKPLSEIEGGIVPETSTTTEAKEEATTSSTIEDDIPDERINELDSFVLDLRSAEDYSNITANDVFFSIDDPTGVSCGATPISDKWLVSASHCFDEFRGGTSVINQEPFKINTFRSNTKFLEVIDIRNVYKHPNYRYGKAHNDIALIEIGRRLEYNYDVYGDSPICMDKGMNLTNMGATVQGYGVTETGDRGELLEGNVTIVSNNYCDDVIDKIGPDARDKIVKFVPYGFNFGLFCALDLNPDVIDGKTAYTSSCSGDSGGPLFLTVDGRRTLAGVVNGGLSSSCTNGYPSWYTHFASHRPWIQCIMNSSRKLGRSKAKVEEVCEDVALPLKPFIDLRG